MSSRTERKVAHKIAQILSLTYPKCYILLIRNTINN